MSNLHARESLERAQRLFLEKPAAAQKAQCDGDRGLARRPVVRDRGTAGEKAVNRHARADGRQRRGANPGWLLRAGMASCTATAIAMRAAMLGIELSRWR